MNKLVWSFIIVVCVVNSAFSQILEDQKEIQLEQAIESISESDESTIDNSEILEDLTTISEHPLNINSASVEELNQLNMLDFRQVQNIINYRKSYGFLVSPYELIAVEGLTVDVVTALTPFITFDIPVDSLGGATKSHRNNLITRIKSSFPESIGYRSATPNNDAAYPGPPVSLYARAHLEPSKRIVVGLLVDNDAGEQFFKGPNRLGSDFYSGFIRYKGEGIIREVVVGDFSLRIGQGLNFGGGGGLGKSANTMGILKFGQNIRPNTSADENRFFRGVSTEIGHGPFKVVVFYSSKNRDANILVDPVSGSRYFTSLQTSGYHRTISEIEDKRSLNEQMYGGYGELKFQRFRLGGLLALQQFNLPMNRGLSPYKAKSFSGRENLNIGLDYQLAMPHTQYFGEVGMSKNGKPGGVQGVVWHVHPQLSLSAYFRYFDPGFNSFYGNSLSESSGNKNETGLYTGIMVSPLPKVKIFGYVDMYHFPWLTYSTMAPSSGSDYMVQVMVSFSRRFTLLLKEKYESKPQKGEGKSGISSDFDQVTNKFRIQSDFLLSDQLMLRTRFEYSGYQFNSIKENGYLAFQDLIYTPWHKLKMWIRYAWFNTDGYNSRIYTFENDLLYSFSIPEFHGRGDRFYLNLKWSPSMRLTAYFKIGYTMHHGASSWGSGNDLTQGDHRTELRGLLNWRF